MRVFRGASILVSCTHLLIGGLAFAQTGKAELEQKVDQIFAAYAKPDSPGCAVGVVRDGKLVYQRGYGMGSLELNAPLTPQSVFYMGSVSKQFTAASVVLAAEQRYLSLDDDIRKYVPEIPSYGTPITLREMLHHTSGFRDVLGLLFLAGRNFEDIHPTSELLDLLSRQKALNYAPGDEYLYSNTNYFLMSVVIHRATGKPLSQFADENIFKPLGMMHTRFYDDRSVVVPGRVPAYEPLKGGGFRVDWSTNFDKVGDGGLMSSVEDLLLWDRNFYDNKLGEGTLLKELQTTGVLNNGKAIEYALGLVVSSYRGLPVVAHSGALFGYRTEIQRFPQQKFSSIVLCNIGTSDTVALSNQIADVYLLAQFTPAAKSQTAAQVDVAPVLGWYRGLESHSVAQLSSAEGGIGAFGVQFKARDKSHFAETDGRAEIAFDSRSGTSKRFTLSFRDTLPEVYESYEPLKTAEESFAQYEGEYTSQELATTYRFVVQNGKLTVTRNWQPAAMLEPTIPDEFQTPEGVAIVFRRDTNGQISGFDGFAGRVRNIFFARTKN